MKNRAIAIAILLGITVPMAGCPFALPEAVKLGTWLFEIEGQPNVLLAVKLSAGGVAEDIIPPPPPADAYFGGLLSWDQNGYAFTMTQNLGYAKVNYNGVVLSSSEIAGSFGALNTQWTANFWQ